MGSAESRLGGRRGWGRGAAVLRGVGPGNEGAAGELGEHFNCSGVVTGGPEVQGLGKGPPGILTGGVAVNFLLAPRA